ncbi:MAG: DNA replication/repair protein RecF [Bacilli bacterium]|jgi:DNA replication and repair protein RecF|nr:DNA replication/repair protein RecF [Bacilli bacterium]MDD2681861.1 DNA replication/repair protein RecF [Bacilli bacterium]MDD4481737.1 DNA replication/repair protein RecF [Bacilli bacterium]MDY0363786.1 DNA replication/repair protein RecF [Bacilli bacterium]
MFYLDSIKLINFRCYNNNDFTFSPTINIIIGKNAIGKTSLVEGIYCLGLIKSYKTFNDELLVKDGDNFYNLKGRFIESNQNIDFMIGYNEKKRKMVRNNQVIKKQSDYIGYFQVVMFSPDDIELVKGTPSNRRRFMDTYIGQFDKKYLEDLSIYKKILKSRNEILKDFNNNNKKIISLMSIYTEKLVEYAKKIVERRLLFFEELNPYIERQSLAISKQTERLNIEYVANVSVDCIEKEITENLVNDIYAKTTTKGPHKDDFEFMINNRNACEYASQGQQRTATLSLKLGLAAMFKDYNDKVIIILDDVFSELDKNRKNNVMKLLIDKGQIFITTTSIKDIDINILNNSKVIEISKENRDNE